MGRSKADMDRPHARDWDLLHGTVDTTLAELKFGSLQQHSYEAWLQTFDLNKSDHQTAYTVCLKKTSPTVLAVTLESIVGFS